MNVESLTRFWPLIYSIVREFWEVTEPYIENAAVKNDIPIELYFYSELGLDYFSVDDFQKRDPFTNPDLFEKMFARFEIKDWIYPMPDERYQVSHKARDAVQMIVREGYAQLTGFNLMSDDELKKLAGLLKQIVTANLEAPEPPEKWAIIKRFRVVDEESPQLVQIRELLMDLFAYRDDSHLSVAHPHFGQAGIVWSVLGSVWNRTALNAKQLSEAMSFRGYEEEDYEVAIQAAVEINWIEPADTPDTFRPTKKGREIREQVERLTDEQFFRPWSVLTDSEIDELYSLLEKLRDQLTVYKKSIASDSHF